jgi:8-oxo-dGTP pyrophosphatase MutT (NUDIX family)
MSETDALAARLSKVERDRTHKNIRPSDAATLLILDQAVGGPLRVLMGKRHMRHRFFPGAFVFPGGKVDASDSRVKVADDYQPVVLEKLMHAMRGRSSTTRARAFGVAALRETYEEAGLFIGTPLAGASPARGPSFAGFAEAGVLPSLAPLRLVARAITPPNRPRRFDTRFLACWATAIAAKTADGLGPSGELENVAWLTFDEAKKTEIPAITVTILDEVAARLATDPELHPSTPVPFYRWRGKGFERTLV